jgi:hypothetical protein
MTNASKAGLFSAMAQGAQGLVQGITTREEAQLARKRSQMELDKLNQLDRSGSTQQQIEILRQQNDAILKDNAKKSLFESFNRFRADGNPRHINAAISSNMYLKEAFPEVTRIDRLDPNADKDLIHNRKLDPELMTDENMQKRFLKVTKPDGSQVISDMSTIYAGTGYTAYLTDIEMQQLLLESQIHKNFNSGSDGADGTDETAMERNAKATAKARDRIARGEGTSEDTEMVRFATNAQAGTTPAKVDLAESATEKLVNMFGGEDQFFETDFSDEKNFRKAYSLVTKIEQLEGSTLSSETKKELRNIAALNALGVPGANLTAKETGLIDNLLVTAKRYMSDEVGGIEATSAYSAFRNTIRHALYGSALTEAEIASFNEAFGTLKQQLGPVLQQFKTAILQVKSKLQSIERMENPYTSRVRLGMDQENVSKVIEALDERIAAFDQVGKVTQNPKVESKQQIASPSGEKPKSIKEAILRRAQQK